MPARLSVDLEWSTTAPAIARRIVTTWLLGQHPSEAALDDVSLVVSELVNRAIDGARGNPHLDAECTEDRLELRVSSSDRLDLTPSDDPFDAIGPLVLAALCDDWGVHRGGDATTQWATIDLTASRGD